jgi:hypothetical protein
MEGGINKLDHYANRKLYGKLPVNESVETPMTSACFSVDCFELKTDRMSSKQLHIESAAMYIHHMQVKMEYCYIGKEN